MDEMVISILPVLIGSGIPLFGGIDLDGKDLKWEHVSTDKYNGCGGIVKNCWRRLR